MNTSSAGNYILHRAIILIFGCSAICATAQPFDLRPVTADSKLANADNAFSFGLLNQIAKGQPGQNIFISPFSAASALQMVANGAAGKTLAEMQDVLNTTGIKQADLDSYCKDLNDSLVSDANVTLDLANGIWYQNGFELKPGFVAENQKYFNAGLQAVDFKDPASAQTINDWADQKTFGKIPAVVSYPFPPDTRMILANAIYFKGTWDEPFDSSLTIARDFHLADGGVGHVPMMEKNKTFYYQEGDGFQAVELPYAGNRLQMVLFLPATNSSVQQLVNSFSGSAWQNKILPGFSEWDGDLIFPKFTLNYDVTLNGPLMAMGMRTAFSPDDADFSGMATKPLCIEAVDQKSYVAVDEKGTEAAAVTTVVMENAMAMMPPERKHFNMIVDRPFFFVIMDDQSQAILFMGIVNDPAS